jgi:hypothetical protein
MALENKLFTSFDREGEKLWLAMLINATRQRGYACDAVNSRCWGRLDAKRVMRTTLPIKKKLRPRQLPLDCAVTVLQRLGWTRPQRAILVWKNIADEVESGVPVNVKNVLKHTAGNVYVATTIIQDTSRWITSTMMVLLIGENFLNPDVPEIFIIGLV